MHKIRLCNIMVIKVPLVCCICGLSHVFQSQLVAHRGFNIEVHNVSVGDGWTVSIHRIIAPGIATIGDEEAQSSTPHGKPKTPVLIPSFLLGSSGFWLTAKRNSSLGESHFFSYLQYMISV